MDRESLTALATYRRYVDITDREAEGLDDDEYLDLLNQGEVVDLLCTRDELADASLTSDEARELGRLDVLLVKHWRLVAEHLPPTPSVPESLWWWYLHEGPHVREQARRVA